MVELKPTAGSGWTFTGWSGTGGNTVTLDAAGGPGLESQESPSPWLEKGSMMETNRCRAISCPGQGNRSEMSNTCR